MKDYYQVLGISMDATADQVKYAYRKLAVLYHPDVSTVPDADKRIKEINEAYNVLSSPQRRANYDLSLSKPATNLKVWAPEYKQSYRPSDSHSKARKTHGNKSLPRFLVKVMPTVRWLSALALAWCLFLAVDLLLPAHSANQVIAKMYFSGDVQIIETRSGKYAVPITDHIKYKRNEEIVVQLSSLLRVPRRIQAVGHKPSKLLVSIYGDLIVIPGLLGILAVLGIVGVGTPLVRIGIGLAIIFVGLVTVASIYTVRILH